MVEVLVVVFHSPHPFLALGKDKGMTQFNLPRGHASPFLYIFANGNHCYGFANASGNTHGIAVFISSNGKMILLSYLDGTNQSALEGMVDDGLGFNLFLTSFRAR